MQYMHNRPTNKAVLCENRHYPISRPLLGIASRVNYQSLIYVARVCESAGTQNYNSAFVLELSHSFDFFISTLTTFSFMIRDTLRMVGWGELRKTWLIACLWLFVFVLIYTFNVIYARGLVTAMVRFN